jgi:hypothetical protein
MSRWKVLKGLYYEAFSDRDQIQNVLAVIGDIYSGTFPDDSPMGLYTVGDVKNCKGFHGSMPMIHELTASMQGRSVRGLMIHLGLSPHDPLVIELLKETDNQQERIVPIIHRLADSKYGTPAIIDELKIADLCSRAARTLQGLT